MKEDIKKYNQLIPKSSTNLVRTQNSIEITNKLLFESRYEWWNKLPDLWKKILNAYIGKIQNYPNFNSIDISCIGSKDIPANQDLEKILQIKHLEYHFWDEHDWGGIESLNTILPIEKLRNLEILKLSDCHSINWDGQIEIIYGLSNLKILEISGSNLSDINGIQQLTKLEELYIDHNFLEDISFLSGLTNLKILLLDNNPIKNFSCLESLTNLNKLKIGNSYRSFKYVEDIGSISFIKRLFKLKFLDLNQTSLRDISNLKNLINLEELLLSWNNIDEIECLKSLYNLKTLNLAGNKSLKNIKPLQNLFKIETLNLSHTSIYDITPLKLMPNLNELRIEHTQVLDFSPLLYLKNLAILEVSFDEEIDLRPFEKLKNLKKLVIHSYNIRMYKAIDRIKHCLPHCNIFHYDEPPF